jgi:TolB-like protein
MQGLAARDIFLFANFRLDRRSGGLFRRGESGAEVLVALGSRALDVLALLLDRRGDLVTKGEIIAAVDTEGASGTPVIGGTAYRVVLATGGGESLPAPKETSASLPLPDKPSIVVLPFQNMSSDPEQEFLADGIAEDVITALSRYSSLFVIARNSSFTYKGRAIDIRQVARELGVRYVLEGSLRKSGNRIRVSAQLVDAETEKHVWAERYERELADLFAVQDEISEAATTAVAPAIAGAERRRAVRKQPGNLDA